jgi:single-strand DNA-binding protein|tara:strand:+ start:601 stop:1020 length:420 start_codon:yes stop_codon:yes gene_type:complete
MLNKMTLIGNVGTDPEMRYTPNGNPVTSFTVATNRRYTTAEGEQREETEWFTVSAWNRLGETINQYLTKGRRVYVEGRLKSSTWTGNDGETRFRNEITANQILMLDRERSTEDEPNTQNQRETGTSATEAGGNVEDLPW